MFVLMTVWSLTVTHATAGVRSALAYYVTTYSVDTVISMFYITFVEMFKCYIFKIISRLLDWLTVVLNDSIHPLVQMFNVRNVSG